MRYILFALFAVLSLAPWATQAQEAAYAVGDSALYQGQRYAVVDSLGAPVLPQDADFAKRAKAKVIHVERSKGKYWLAAGFVHVAVIPPNSPFLLLYATFAQIAAAPKTTGYVIWSAPAEGDTTIHVNVSAADLTKIEPDDE